MIIAKRKLLLSVSIIAVVGFLITFYVGIFESSRYSVSNMNNTFNESEREQLPRSPPFMGEQFKIPFYILPLSSVLLIVAIIPISYYFISKRFEERLERKFDVISKLMKKK